MVNQLGQLFSRQHIQNFSSASSVIHHWGYADRVIPCTNDAGSCAYLDGVYWMHDVSMLYTFILWAVLGGLLALFVLSRALKPARNGNNKREREMESGTSLRRMGMWTRSWKSVTAMLRGVLLPESGGVFAGVTRLQLLLLTILISYLLIFS